LNIPKYFVEETLRDGSAVTIRAVRPDDKERLVEAFLHLQPETIRTRFFHAKRRLGEEELRWLSKIDRGKHFGLVATVPRQRERAPRLNVRKRIPLVTLPRFGGTKVLLVS
jgi:hypothetical protein